MSYTATMLDKAQAALDAGNRDEARALIKPIVEAEPGNARAWYLLADATDDEEQRFFYKSRGEAARAADTTPAAQVAPTPTIVPSDPPVAPATPRRRKKTGWIATAVLLAIVAAIAGFGFGADALATIGVTLPWSCKAQATAYDAKVSPILDQWQDGVKVAGSSSRIALGPQISKLQDIQRQAKALDHPSCAEEAHAQLITGLEEGTEAFIAFMGQKPETEVSKHFTAGATGLANYRSEMDQLKSPAHSSGGNRDVSTVDYGPIAFQTGDLAPSVRETQGNVSLSNGIIRGTRSTFQSGSTIVGLVTVRTYESTQAATRRMNEASAQLSDGAINTVKITDLGESTMTTLGRPTGESLTLLRCNTVVEITLTNNYGSISDYARKIDDRLKASVCP